MERAEELESLSALRSEIDGDDSADALQAQIDVIEAMMTKEQVYELWESDTFITICALEAERWLRDDDEAPSQYWAERDLLAA